MGGGVREALSEEVALSKDLNNESCRYLGASRAEERADSKAPRWAESCRAWKL